MRHTTSWYRFRNAADRQTARLEIADFIGDGIDEAEGVGISARRFVEDLQALPASVRALHVHINSPGGWVDSATYIANALLAWGAQPGRSVRTICEGLAASAATLTFVAGSERHIRPNALLMVHNCWTVAQGSATDFRKVAATLEQLDATIAGEYARRTGLAEVVLRDMMAAETWMNADEALANGFATAIVDAGQAAPAAAQWQDRSVAALRVPDRYRDQVAAFVVPGARLRGIAASANFVMSELQDIPDRLPIARDLIAAGASENEVRDRARRERQATDALNRRASEIHGACRLARLPQLADSYVSSRMSAADVRAQLTIIIALHDTIEIDGSLLPETPRPTGVSTPAIYRSRREAITNA